MNIEDLAPQSLLMKALAWLLAVVLVIGGLLALAHHFESIGYQRRINEEQQQLNKDLLAAAQETQRLQHKLNEAQNELNIQKQRIATLTAANGALTGQLRSSIAQYNGHLSSDSRQALEKRIQALSIVVQECTERYTALAGHADATELDLELFDQSYPKN